PTMMEEGQEGCGGRTEERIPACGVVWKEAPESAIHSVLTGGVRPVALKDCASAAWSHPPGQVGCWLGGAGGVQNGANRGAAAAGMATGWGRGRVPATAWTGAACATGATACAAAREAAARAVSLGVTAWAACAAGATAWTC